MLSSAEHEKRFITTEPGRRRPSKRDLLFKERKKEREKISFFNEFANLDK